MPEVNDILAHISNMANEINNTFKEIPLDSQLKTLSPIDDINKNCCIVVMQRSLQR